MAGSSSAVAGSTAPGRNPNRPKYSKFSQQELPACQPILTPKLVITAFTIIGIIFIPIGIASLSASQDVVEISNRYETECIPEGYRSTKDDKIQFIQNPQSNKNCTRTLTVPKHMKQPIYVYYQLDNFYQNHRRYVKSKSDKQLRSPGSESDTSDCKPENNANGMPIVPCGLIAWSLFNDTYSFTRNNYVSLTVNKTGISWKSDREHKFGKGVYPKNFQSGGLIGGGSLVSSIPLSEQEDLMVWMRTAAMPTFRKLYGKIEFDLQANDVIEVSLKNNYNVYSFNGKKRIVLSTANWIGGKNDFLGVAYITVGGICFFLALCFTALYLKKPSRLQDPSYLTWNTNPGPL
ncbi:CDC50/LEM3 family [Dillenia turbinata]|uniref:ALA-interacting subunit n=1 Tax=Dillenia turbinata TaxID=194707 RepID=A0AAN8Z472_9MAGN